VEACQLQSCYRVCWWKWIDNDPEERLDKVLHNTNWTMGLHGWLNHYAQHNSVRTVEIRHIKRCFERYELFNGIQKMLLAI
jgi:hypothetical protein